MKVTQSSHVGLKIGALGAPVLILAYGLVRLFALLNGKYEHGGLAWESGHALFFVSFILFAVLSVGLRQLVPAGVRIVRVIAYVLMSAGLFGAACFLWGILGDLFSTVQEEAPVVGPLRIIGPLLFQVGLLGLLVILVATRPRRLPFWSPILVLIGFILFAAELNFLPIGALVILVGLLPLFRRSAVA